MEETRKNVTRKNIVALFEGQSPRGEEDSEVYDECDRIFIAFYKLQTDGSTEYRRLLGYHGGGGGTSVEDDFPQIYTKKVEKDRAANFDSRNGLLYNDDEKNEPIDWPNPSESFVYAPDSKSYSTDNPNYIYAYTFCWHGKPEFLLWHRALLCELDYLLQTYDPKYLEDTSKCHIEGDALGCPYWAWEGWEGQSLPGVLSDEKYKIKTEKYHTYGEEETDGDGKLIYTIRNPFYRWFIPVGIESQVAGTYPTILTDKNATRREKAFGNYQYDFENAWQVITQRNENGRATNPRMRDVVYYAMNNPHWKTFCTTDKGGTWSIENAHNKLHNRIGGKPLEANETEVGQMVTFQSAFDPAFFLHHSNVERQFYSWQKLHNTNTNGFSAPEQDEMDVKLYPFTKPGSIANGDMSWNSEADSDDATVRSWWDLTPLNYEYDEYLGPQAIVDHDIHIPNEKNTLVDFRKSIRLMAFIDKKDYVTGEFKLLYSGKLVGAVSIISGVNSGCVKCHSSQKKKVVFDVATRFEAMNAAKDAFERNELTLMRNGNQIVINEVKIEPWLKA